MVPEIRSATDILGHFGPLLAVLPNNNLKNQNVEKMKSLEVSSFYTCVPQMTII